MLGLGGSILLALGVFAPLISLPVLGSLNYFRNGQGDGVIVLILAGVGIVLSVFRIFKGVLFAALASLAIMTVTFIQFQTKMSSMKSEMQQNLAGNPFRGLAEAAIGSVQLEWGWGLLLLGVGLMTASSLVGIRAQSRRCPFCAETIQLEAALCHFCGRDLGPAFQAERSSPIPVSASETQLEWTPVPAANVEPSPPAPGSASETQLEWTPVPAAEAAPSHPTPGSASETQLEWTPVPAAEAEPSPPTPVSAFETQLEWTPIPAAKAEPSPTTLVSDKRERRPSGFAVMATCVLGVLLGLGIWMVVIPPGSDHLATSEGRVICPPGSYWMGSGCTSKPQSDPLRGPSGQGASVSILRGGQRIDKSVHSAQVNSQPSSAPKRTNVSLARGAGGLSAPPTGPPGPPPAVDTQPADPPAAAGAPGSASLANGALEAKAAPRLAPSVERYSWILGTWEAVEDKSGIVDGLARFDFWHDGVQLRWRMRRAGWLSGVHTKQEASGTVGKISDSTVELNGKYEITNVVGVGQPIRHTLSRDGDRLRGYELSSDGMRSPWFLVRIR